MGDSVHSDPSGPVFLNASDLAKYNPYPSESDRKSSAGGYAFSQASKSDSSAEVKGLYKRRLDANNLIEIMPGRHVQLVLQIQNDMNGKRKITRMKANLVSKDKTLEHFNFCAETFKILWEYFEPVKGGEKPLASEFHTKLESIIKSLRNDDEFKMPQIPKAQSERTGHKIEHLWQNSIDTLFEQQGDASALSAVPTESALHRTMLWVHAGSQSTDKGKSPFQESGFSYGSPALQGEGSSSRAAAAPPKQDPRMSLSFLM